MENNLDQYYTKDHIVTKSILNIETLYKNRLFYKIIEPSAGTGSFLKGISKSTLKYENLEAYDIAPKYENILEHDYLKLDIPILQDKDILVLGNPPFGRQCSIAKKFIKKSCKYANVIAFILPRSFKKESVNKCFDLQFHLKYQEDIEPKAFIFNDLNYDVPCVFQIWERLEYDRPITAKQTFDYKVYYFTPDQHYENIFAFKRVGCKAGLFVYDNITELSKQSHYFIYTISKISESQKQLLNSIIWPTNNTTGPKSISKQDLIPELNKILK